MDIRTPLAKISVGGAEDGAATGLPVYPGAELSSRGDGRESANVDIGTAWFGVKVVAAEYETDDQPRQILEFYRDAMSRYGEVTECRGDVKFRGPKGDRRPVCREDMFERDLKLVVGTEHRQRIVAIKPRADYTEFALVYIATRPD